MNPLHLRSDLLKAVRQYFHDAGLLEVTTPTLGHYGVSDPNLDNLTLVHDLPTSSQKYYLQTSPEYAMKRLLAKYKTSIFQICPAYRGAESGVRHRPEFQMLEWYRCGFDLFQLMDDVAGLLYFCVDKLAPHRLVGDNLMNYLRQEGYPERVEYQTLFRSACELNPHTASLDELRALAATHNIRHLADGYGDKTGQAERQDYLDALFALLVEPGLRTPVIVYDFPACQAALAKLHKNDQGDTVSSRFELYALGMELANAYDELNDEAELRARFASNNQLRRHRGLPTVPDDEDLLQAVNNLPACSGIALGIDRLLMAMMGADSIAAVQSL